MTRSDDRFLDSVYVTSSSTVIDELAIQGMREDLDRGIFLLNSVTYEIASARQALEMSYLMSGQVGDSLGTLGVLEARLIERHQQLSTLREKLGMTLLIFFAAESQAAQFNQLLTELSTPLPHFIRAFIDTSAVTSAKKAAGKPWWGQPAQEQRTHPLTSLLAFAWGNLDSVPTSLEMSLTLNQWVKESSSVDEESSMRLESFGAEAGYRSSPGRGSWWSGTPSHVPVLAADLGYDRYPLGLVLQGPDRFGRTQWTHRVISSESTLAQPHSLSYRNEVRQRLLQGGREELFGPQAANHLTDTPLQPSALLTRIDDLAAGQRFGQFEILKHETPTSHGVQRSWSVIIRGTQKWSSGGKNPQDLATNLQGVGGLESDQVKLVAAALKDAGVASAEPVEFIGHSQGGIVAVQLASAPEITSHYTVSSVLTAGSPVGAYAPDTQVGVLNLENLDDMVPALDGSAANTDEAGGATVYFDGQALGLTDEDGEPVFAHDLSVYSTAMERLQEANDESLSSVGEWIKQRRSVMGLTEQTQTTSMLVNTTRYPRPSAEPRLPQ